MSLKVQRSVPFFVYQYLYLHDEKNLGAVIEDVCRRGAFIMQKDLREFEKDVAAFQGAGFAVGVGNATDALELALAVAGIGMYDEVIFCSHTFVATAGAIHAVGATPVPVDCGRDGLIDPASITEAITPATKAIMPTQLNGRTCDMEAVLAIADMHGLIVVEDAAQGLGSRFKGKAAGTFGVASGISFYPAKVLGCFGDGGVVLTNDPEIAKKLFMMRDHGRDEHGDTVCWGRNSRLDNLQAAILKYGLKTYDKVIARRRKLAGMYQERLSRLIQLQLPPAPESDPDHFDIYQNYEMQAERRDALRAFLWERGIGTLIQWGGKAVHQFEKLGFTKRLPTVEHYFERCLMLPINMAMGDEDVDYVCDRIRDFYST